MGAVIALPLTFIAGLLTVNLSDFLYNCKWVFSFIYIEICNRLTEKRLDLYDLNATDDPEKANFIVTRKEYVLESPLPETRLLKENDGIFFYGVNSSSERLIVSISRHCGQKAEACIYLKLSSGKTYQLERTTDYQRACDESVFSCGDLQVHYTSPMRRWRIFYNGFLREIDENNSHSERLVHVKFALIWRASSDIFDISADIDSNLLGRGMAGSDWKNWLPPLTKFRKALDSYGQSGVIHGTISVGDELAEQEIYLFGQRIRYLGNTLYLKNMEFQQLLGYVPKNGLYFHLGIISASNVVKNLCFGYVVQPDANVKSVQKLAISDMSNFLDKHKVTADFKAEQSYELTDCILSRIDKSSPDEQTKGNFFCHMKFKLNGKKGYGVFIKRNNSRVNEIKPFEISSLKCPSVIPLTVSFTERICQIPEITGGKGSSLGKLTVLSTKLQTFIVPSGIVVTTSAYGQFITEEISTKIKLLEDVLYTNKGDVKKACESVSKQMIDTKLSNKVASSIKKSMETHFGMDLNSQQFAVRSSATGEDTEQMSAAGQMETFLGISGIDQILTAVKKCWASQFSYVSVQYKRRNGQPLNTPMAVVIQKMVSCDVAGVLFTCDPLTGNPTVMTIAANYGLGESVVSGSEEPDTIVIQRDVNNDLTIKTINIGVKSHKVVIEGDKGASVEDIPENQKNICCLTDEMVLRLGRLGIKIEKFYRSSSDIEWGFCNNNLYIFQSRPVTSGTNETIYEIEHEFDGPLRLENDFFSISNVGEVSPGAFSPLGNQAFYRFVSTAVNREKNAKTFQLKVRAKYFPIGWTILYNHVMFNISDVFHKNNGEKLDHLTQAILIAFFGRVLDDKDICEVTKERYGVNKDSQLPVIFNLLKNLALTGRLLRKNLKFYNGYRIPIEYYTSAKDLFDALLKHCCDLIDVLMCHLICTQTSSVWNMVIFSTLGEAQGEFDDVVYRDFANLLKTIGEVESADVPAAIQSIAYHISEEIKPEEFKRMDPEEALKWLQTSSSVAGKMFRSFLERHGHRCLKEFDIYSRTWGENPQPLARLLQNMTGNVTKDFSERKSDNVSKCISELKVPMGFLSRLKLRLLLPLSRRGVQNRERSKSLLVKGVDAWRKGYRQLAKLMVREGRIPEADLLYFMSLEEIRDLLETRSPKVLARASQRQKRHPVLDKYIFPEIMKGLPRPMNEKEYTIISSEENFSMKGIPVSQGIAQGFVRVSITLDEAAFLKPGEILLTHGTDIGWTPYFPTLAGVVTELGGLISHGAVVSREYGIPCIAGLHGATRRFQTGDYVLLDGNKGILHKITPPKN